MGIDGLIFLDNTGRPIIQSGFRASPSAYPLLHIDAYNNAAAKAARPGDVDPVLYVQAYNISDGPSACCHIACGDMRLLCPISGDVDPLFAFAFLQAFIDILNEYFGNISAATLKDNFDTVYQLLEETLDSSGQPLTTSPNALRDIVLLPSLMSKLLSAAAANFTSTINAGSGPAAGTFSSQIPWRKANLRYASNEVYVDVHEELRAIVNKHGTALSSNVWGKLEANTKLSGYPDCTLTFSNSHVLTDCVFHPCVRLQKWNRDRILSFVPPDGRFTLMEYRYSPAASASSSAAARLTATTPAVTTGATSSSLAITKDTVPVPIAAKISVEFEENTASFDITLTSRLTSRAIEHVVAELHLGEGATGIKCVASRGTGGSSAFSRGIGAMDVPGVPGSSGASWVFDSKRMVLRWEIPSMQSSSSWNIQGSFTSATSKRPRPSHALQIRFEIATHTFSALKVDQLKILNEQYKLFKGVRGRSLGDIEWRW
ncbi:clathrin adaptor, mu subunit [Pluteus cervinus]|uniref:Clathrin adaptor, mu subunit n=1 Tax=Pluteus cervinus TaxID=181527 RepID=A0ACD3B7Z2_9AGAR|nr:clathrin adaptor, mu subunit [Pluteus cervinus]